jgi:hypothetical protein
VLVPFVIDEPVDKGFGRDDFGHGFLFTYPVATPLFAC